MPYRGRAFQIDFDLLAHELVIRTSEGTRQSLGLRARSVADFYNDVFALLETLDILIDINPIPQEVPNPISFEKDDLHASYDREYVERFFRVLSTIDTVFKRHRAPFKGRHSPVHFFWGSFDLAYTRYCGRPSVPPASVAKMVQLSLDAEEIYAGFWPGDARLPEPAFGAYVYPKPERVEQSRIAPSGATWNKDIGLFVLRYEDVRTSGSPEDAVLEFLGSTYGACSSLAAWDQSLVG